MSPCRSFLSFLKTGLPEAFSPPCVDNDRAGAKQHHQLLLSSFCLTSWSSEMGGGGCSGSWQPSSLTVKVI